MKKNYNILYSFPFAMKNGHITAFLWCVGEPTAHSLVRSFSTNEKKLQQNSSKVLDKNYNIYSDLNYFLNNNPINEESQRKIEKFLLTHAINSNELENKDIGGIYSGLYSKKTTKFLNQFRPVLTEKVNNFLKFKDKYLENNKKGVYLNYLVEIIEVVGISFVVSVLLGRFLRILSNSKNNFSYEKNLVLDIALDLSKDLINEFLKKKMKKHQNYLLKEDLIKSIKDYTFSDWKKENQDLIETFNDSTVRVNIGVFLIEWLEDNNLITKKLIQLSDKKHNIYTVGDNLIKDLENNLKVEVFTYSDKSKELIDSNNSVITHPFRIPLIIKPKPYIKKSNGEINLGGYYLNDEDYADELILPNNALDKQSVIYKKNIIYDVLNNINSVAYKINSETLNFININPHFYKDSLIELKHPLENKSKLTKTEKNTLQKHISKLDLQEHILKLAHLFNNLNEIFFVNRIDNRGRLYCMTEYLNYQSCELAKSLLLFSKPNKIKKIGDELSISYFKAYGAHCFGNKINKLSLVDKEKWIDLNTNNIINYDNGILIQQAENKFLFTSFCIEFKKWHNFYHNSDNTYFNTYLPIQLDASCNGFQHLVLLSNEVNLRSPLNLIEMDHTQKPNDFYAYVLEMYKEHLNTLNKSDFSLDENQSYDRIKNFNLDRKLIKKMIMTIPYNATSKKMVDDIADVLIRVKGSDNQSWFIHPEDSLDTKTRISYKDLFLLVSSIREQLDKTAPKVSKLKEYLYKIANICTDLETHIPWLLPIGLEIRQSYLKEKSVNLKPFAYSTSKVKLSIYTEKLDLNKQSRAFMPNLIHSLDASSLMLLLNKYFNNKEFDVKNIYTIHDCFVLPMNHIEFIIDSLRKVYISLYSDSKYLEELDESILQNIKKQYRYVTLDTKTNILSVEVGSQVKKYVYPNIKEVLGKELPLEMNTRYLLI